MVIQSRKRTLARAELVGGAGVNTQDARAKEAGESGAAREAVRRVGEYKRGRVDPADGNNEVINRRSQEDLN